MTGAEFRRLLWQAMTEELTRAATGARGYYVPNFRMLVDWRADELEADTPIVLWTTPAALAQLVHEALSPHGTDGHEPDRPPLFRLHGLEAIAARQSTGDT